MGLLAVASLIVAIAAVVIAAFLRLRLAASERSLESVRRALGQANPDADVEVAAKDLAAEAERATTRANTYASALQGAAVGIAMLDAAGAVGYANPAAQLLLEGDGERAILRSRVSALGKRVHATGKAESIEVDVHDPDRRVLMLTAVPVSLDGEGFGSVCLYIDDLSDRRRIDAMRTDFVANASHELKTPLGALSLLAETLAETRDEDARARLAKRLQTEANRMASVIDDIIQLAETESLGSEFSLVPIGELVGDAVSGIEAYARDRGIDLVNRGIEDAVVAADRELVVSAIRNLINNAITYSAVKDQQGRVAYGARIEKGLVHVEVADSGIGIPDRYQDRVFERFFRVDRARSRESGGTGLGLSIVRNVALAHGGDVALESKVGVGSTFTFSLPIVVEEHEGAEV